MRDGVLYLEACLVLQQVLQLRLLLRFSQVRLQRTHLHKELDVLIRHVLVVGGEDAEDVVDHCHAVAVFVKQHQLLLELLR
jgi:hypothetical protein